MSVDVTKRISFSEVATGMHIPSPVTLREEKWSTWSSPVGWPVQGMWINKPSGVLPTAVQRSWGGLLIAGGDNSGRLTIAHNPCPTRAGFIGSLGHAGPISQVAWLAGDGTIVTTGNKDHCVLQWKCMFDGTKESGDEGGASCNDSEVERDAGHEIKDGVVVRHTDNFGRSPGWITAIAPPSDVKDDNTTGPGFRPEVDFVHGMRSGDVRGNLCYNEDGHVVYSSVTYGIVYDRDTQEQRIYEDHKNAVISVCVDTSGKVACTGELADSPELHFWDARTARSFGASSKFVGLHKKGITNISFSDSGEYLVSLGQDAMHGIVVLRSPSKGWKDGFVLCSTSVSPKKMLFCKFIEGNNHPIVVGGRGT